MLRSACHSESLKHLGDIPGAAWVVEPASVGTCETAVGGVGTVEVQVLCVWSLLFIVSVWFDILV